MYKEEFIKKYGEVAWRKRRAYISAWQKANPEKANAKSRACYKRHSEKAKARSRTRYEREPEYWKARHEANLEKENATRRARYRAEPEKEKIQQRAWQKNNPDKMKSYKHKRERNLGFIPINESFEGSHAHHVDKDFVLYIPAELHRIVAHNVFTGKNMEKINAKAFGFVYKNDREGITD